MKIIGKNTDVKIKCYKCGNEQVMGMMRMDANGRNLVCRNCLDRKVSSKEYFCKACKYNFKRAKHLVISTCPYCGSGNLNVKGSTVRIMADAFRMKGE